MIRDDDMTIQMDHAGRFFDDTEFSRGLYETPGTIIKTLGKYRIVSEHAGDREFSMWGPDITGRDCRMARYSDQGRALRALREVQS